MITSKRKLHLIPLATAGLGLAVFGAGIGLALTGHELALVPVGTCNLSTVLAITGTAVIAPSVFAFYRLAAVDKLSCNLREKHKLGYGANWLAIVSIASIAVAALTYGAVHMGIAQLIPVSWSVSESIGLQAGVGFILGCITYMIATAIGLASLLNSGGTKEDIYNACRAIILTIIEVALLGMAATISGPALTNAIGVAANSVEAIALESLIAVSITSLVGLCLRTSLILDEEGYLGRRS